MHAMVLRARGAPMNLEERPDPHPLAGQIRIRVEACAVCRTDLHVIDGELPHVHYPIVPGHEIVGRVEALGGDVRQFAVGQRVGCLGWGRPAGNASTAAPRARIFAMPRSSRVIAATAALQRTSSQRRPFRFRWMTLPIRSLLPLSCARG